VLHLIVTVMCPYENCADSAVYVIANVLGGGAINEAIQSAEPKSSTFPHWFSNLLYIRPPLKRKIRFIRSRL
jgi:hypothetical protein